MTDDVTQEVTPKKVKKTRKIKPDLNSRIGQYFLAKTKGKNKGQAALAAGYPDVHHVTQIEKSKTYQAIEKAYYKDSLLGKISLDTIAAEHIKNITQDDDKGAKNKAIEMALNKIEPEEHTEVEEQIMVVLKG